MGGAWEILAMAVALGGCAGKVDPATDAGADAVAAADGAADAGPTATECTPGEFSSQACGYCGLQSRSCGPKGTWDPWMPCHNLPSGECKEGETRTVPCSRCGTRLDTCGYGSCRWFLGECAGEGECNPLDMEGTGTGCPSGEMRTRTCDAKCTWGPYGACK